MKNINLYNKNIKSLIERQKYYKYRTSDWSVSMIFSSYDSYIINQVNLYWPLIGNGIRPKSISLDTSLCLLKTIIDNRRVFDSYFNTINATSITIARMVYKIMDMSIKNKIPLSAISKRLERFKRGKKNNQTYNDLNNLIVEYRSILNKNKLYDKLMIYEKFIELLGNDQYPKKLKDIGMCIIKENCVDNTNKEGIKYDNTLLYEDFKLKNIVKEEYQSYSDTKKALENLLYRLKYDNNVSESDIVIMVANLNKDIESMVEDISKNINIRLISYSEKFGSNAQAIVCLSALAIYKDCEYILSYEDKMELLKVVYKNENYIYLRKNMENLLRKLRDNIRKNMSPILDLDSIDEGDDPSLISIEKIEEGISMANFHYEYSISDSEFVKKFYRNYIKHTEESISLISRMTDLLEEIGDLVDDESKYNYIKQSISYYSSSKIKLENLAMSSVLVLSKEDIEILDTDRKHLIIFDANTKKYDPVLEDSIYTYIAFLDDSILSNITKENLSKVYRDLLEYELDAYIDGLVSNYKNIYIMTSDKGINGYEQENIFYKRLIDKIDRLV